VVDSVAFLWCVRAYVNHYDWFGRKETKSMKADMKKIIDRIWNNKCINCGRKMTIPFTKFSLCSKCRMEYLDDIRGECRWQICDQ
jgi:hypothetical protein